LEATDSKTQTVARNGRNQALRIPRKFQLEGDEVIRAAQIHRFRRISPNQLAARAEFLKGIPARAEMPD